MRINQSKIRRNMFNEVTIPECPWFREEAEKVIMLLEKIPPFNYTGLEDFSRKVVAEYWRYYDNLEAVLTQENLATRFINFREWLAKEATDPDHIQRAIRWLMQKDNAYLIPPQSMKERAYKRADKISETIGASQKA